MLTYIKTSFVKSRLRLLIKIEKFVGGNLSDFWAQRLEGRLTLTRGQVLSQVLIWASLSFV